MTIPPKPATFHPEQAPAGVQIKFVSYWQQRAPMSAPRIMLVHTNAASGEGSLDSSSRWSEAAPGSNTLPHYQVDRRDRGSGFIGRKMLPTNRRGIANQTASNVPDFATYGTVQHWSLAIETADLGFPTPGGSVGFTDDQAEMVATILAYESIVHGIPLDAPSAWYGSGTASHTDPFGYPFWTIAAGKTCPGETKKFEVRNRILPRAREIKAAWTAPPDPPNPPEDDDMQAAVLIAPTDENMEDTFWWSPAAGQAGWVPNGAAMRTGIATKAYIVAEDGGPIRTMRKAEIQQLINSQWAGGQLPPSGWTRPTGT